MKNILKVLLLGTLTVGMAVACNEKTPASSGEAPVSISSNPASSEEAQSSMSESLVSSASSMNPSSSQAQSSSSNHATSSHTSSSPASSSSSSVAPVTLTGIAINIANVKVEYVEGEALDLTGLVVTAKYSDNTTEAVTDYTTDPANGAVLSTVGPQIVTVTYQTFSKTFAVTVEEAPKSNWTEEEAKVMSDHLYGIVLPFPGFEDSTVEYDAESYSVIIHGGAFTSEYVLDYATTLYTAGYTLYGSQAATETSAAVYAFRGGVQTEDGARFISVIVTAQGDELYILANDPYEYEFPSFLAEDYAAYMGSNDIAPALDGALFYEYSYDAIAIFCYMNSTTEDAGYSAVLEGKGWYIQEEKDSYGYFVAVAPDYSYQVSYLYQTGRGRLAIYFEMVGNWQPDFFTKTFAKHSAEAFDIPAYEAAAATYLFMEGSGVMLVGVYGTTAAEANAYIGKWQEAGWTVAVNQSTGVVGFTKEIQDKGIANARLNFDAQNGRAVITINIDLDPFPTAEWPTDLIASKIYAKTDIVPAYEGTAESYAVRTEGSYNIIKVEVEVNTEKTAVAAYIETIKQAGYELVEGMTTIYLSPNSELYISVSVAATSDGTGYFEIIFYDVPETSYWPYERVADYFGDEITDTVPGFEILDDATYSWEPDDAGLWIGITLDEESEDPEEVVATYEELVADYNEGLVNDFGFKFVFEDDGMEYYVSPDYQIVVSAYYDEYWECIYVFANTVDALTEGQWPAFHVMFFFMDHHYTDELPVYDGDFVSADATMGTSSLRIDVVLETEDADEIKAAADHYMDLLEEELFTLIETLDEGTCKVYLSPNNQYEVSVMYQPDGFTIQIDETASETVESETFPAEQLFEAIPDLQDVLPVYEDENATFSAQIQSDYAEIYVMFDDASLVSDAAANYIAALKLAGFVERDGTNFGYDTIYYTPDGDYYVAITEYLEDDPAGFDIEIFEAVI